MEQKQEQKIEPGDAQLQELVRWMLDSVTVRTMLKRLIAYRDNRDNAWIRKEISGKYFFPDDNITRERKV